MSDFMQFVFSGLTTGAIYALAALGFSLIYNASGVINFAQGDFLMLGGMVTAALLATQMPYGLAMAGGVVATVIVGLLLYRLAIQPAGEASVVSLIIITIGASIFIQGVVQIVLGKNQQTLPPFSGDRALQIMGAYVLPQSLWVLGTAAVLVALCFGFFRFTMVGKAMLAVAANALAARAVGIPTARVLQLSFGLSALLGAVAGVVAAPVTTTVYDIGLMLGMKGFVAATLGGLGSGLGAVVGGLIVGLLEALVAGYISSAYKDAVPFVMIIVILLVMPHGLFGAKASDRV
ncbi:branched-chain amino acid ABC transporter permease [Variovorax saccharolyticus]|uniref:branched-chain amino acid ABC transporter permease n=1 Tax=Variovorax saccharolyticus TaxID=3053516 RepID=UPI0025760340|nr:branched-chain amino acid ABC transporter permease [Variovorax sp. J31P216]MDM0024539.1 branched-chain amino acid ABC transporter permease [Variovorax sp. J31P216]